VGQTFTRAGGMCPRCEGMGSVTDIDLTQLFDESKSPPTAFVIEVFGNVLGVMYDPHYVDVLWQA
jgi:excinuclease UvrABC ATPase subunit